MIDTLSNVTHGISHFLHKELENISDSTGVPKYAIPAALTVSALVITCLWQRRNGENVPRKFEFTVEKLVETDEAGRLAIHLVAEAGNLEAIKILHSNGAKLDSPDGKGNTPMHFAARNGKLQAMQLLNLLGSNIDSKNEEGQASIHLAVQNNKPEAVKELVKLGASLTLGDKDGNTPMDLACIGSELEMINILKELGADAEQSLQKVIKNGQLEIDMEATRITSQKTPVMVAIEDDDLEMVRHLHSHGADMNFYTEQSSHPLVQAVDRESGRMVHLLCELGADPNSAWIHASKTGKLEMVKILYAYGADLNLKTEHFGFTALNRARKAQKNDVVEYLLSIGAS